MLLLILIVLFLVCVLPGAGYYGYRQQYYGGGIGILGVVILIAVLLWMFSGAGYLRLPH